MAGSPMVVSGAPSAGVLASGQGYTTAAHLGAGATLAKTAAVGSVLGSLFYTAAVVAAGYLGYRAAKALVGGAAKKTAKT